MSQISVEIGTALRMLRGELPKRCPRLRLGTFDARVGLNGLGGAGGFNGLHFRTFRSACMSEDFYAAFTCETFVVRDGRKLSQARP